MAGVLGLMLIIATAEGMEKVKAKRAAKKEAKEEAIHHQERETYFQSSKAREAEEELRRAENRESLEQAGPSSVHPALRGGRPVEAPPPYLKDAPSYDEHYDHAKVPDVAYEDLTYDLSYESTRRGGPFEDYEPVQVDPVAAARAARLAARPGESEEQRRKRLRKEYFRKHGLLGMSGMAGMM